MEKAYYAIVRYVPDPARGESINVGVVVTTPTGEFFRARFDDRLSRIRCLAPDESLDSIRSLADVLEKREETGLQTILPIAGVTGWDLRALQQLHEKWGHSIQFTEPRIALDVEPARLLDDVYGRFVAVPDRPARRARGKQWVLHQILPRLRDSI